MLLLVLILPSHGISVLKKTQEVICDNNKLITDKNLLFKILKYNQDYEQVPQIIKWSYISENTTI